MNLEQKIGFNQIRSIVKSYCISPLGEDTCDRMKFIKNFELLKVHLNLTEEMRNIILFKDSFPFDYYFDVRTALSRIEVENTWLTLQELFDLRRSCATLKLISDFLANSNESDYPYLKQLCKDINPAREFFVIVDEVLDSSLGIIRDSATPELRRIRIEKNQKLSQVSSIVGKLLHQAKQEGWVEKDAQISIRDGKMLIPVISQNKRKINGVVYDESSTGKTSFIEPMASIEMNNAIRQLEFEEQREITKILIATTDKIRPLKDDLLDGMHVLGHIDFLHAKAKFAVEINAFMPKIVPNASLDIRQAKNPLLTLRFKNTDKKVVPLDININDNQRIVMISGPNAGGKSVCLKTTALLIYMHQCGMLTPMSANSIMGIFKSIFIDIGDDQSMDNDLSTYSSHLSNMKYFLENATAKSIVFIDEFGSGTEPILGGAIAEAILTELNNNKVRGVITTHYTNLKTFASNTEGLINGAMLYNRSELSPLFELKIGKAGSSFAFEIAQNIGLDASILANAEEIAGREHVDYERRLEEIDELERKLRLRLENVSNREKNLSNLQDKFNNETTKTLEERKKIIKQAKQQAEDILKTANKRIENTISEIRDSQAEKDKTKLLRKNLEEYKQQVSLEISQEEQKIELTMERIRQKQQEKQEKRLKKQQEKEELAKKILPPKEPQFKIGDLVQLDNNDGELKILEIKDNTALVQMGNMQTFVALKRLTKITKKKEEKPKSQISVNIKTEVRRGDFLYGLDIRGCRGDEAMIKVQKYIDDALAADKREIKILHGTGTGALRQMVRDYLNTQLIVKKFYDEKVELGGAGITVVELDY